MANESLDIEDFAALLQYLRESGRIGAEETPMFTRLTGGVSNRAILVERENGKAWVLKQALPRLRVSVEWLSDPRRIEREAAGIRELAKLVPPGSITPLIFLDAPCFVLAMEAVPQPHQNWKTMLLAGDVRTSHVEQFGNLLGCIHRGGWEHRTKLAQEFEDRSFFKSLRLDPYYQYAAGQQPAAAEFLNRLIDRTVKTRHTLVHGDFSPKNVLVYNDQLILLDHEVIHFGQGAFDIGFAMAHLLSKGHHLTTHRSAFVHAANDFYRSYRESLGDVPWKQEAEKDGVSHALGCLLARCVGRSPLEYLDKFEKDRQVRAVLKLIQHQPDSVASLADEFIAAIEGG